MWVVNVVGRKRCGLLKVWVVESVGHKQCGSLKVWVVKDGFLKSGFYSAIGFFVLGSYTVQKMVIWKGFEFLTLGTLGTKKI